MANRDKLMDTHARPMGCLCWRSSLSAADTGNQPPTPHALTCSPQTLLRRAAEAWHRQRCASLPTRLSSAMTVKQDSPSGHPATATMLTERSISDIAANG